LTELTFGYGATSRKLCNNTGWITVTALTQWEIVIVLLAGVAGLAVKVVLAITLAKRK
jgi:hypothetical protein